MEDKKIKARLLLKGERPELVEEWPRILEAWPNRNKVIQEANLAGYNTVRFIGKQDVITMDMITNRLNIFFDDNNKIYEISRG